MHFDFSVPIKKQKNHTQKVNIKLYHTIIKDVYCVAIIDINGNYYAKDIINGDQFIITSRSYNVKTNVYYSQQLVGDKRLQIFTNEKVKFFNMPWIHLPFAPGVGMLGNIVKSEFNEQLMFDLTRTFKLPKDNELSREAFLYYRDNYSEIYNNILIKYGVNKSI